ncbi:MAG: cell division protein FtsA [Candidatus Riflebacteria bacterium]|nr:cell division protein FtsA [Candidatus Riflebacteria bacterium]
MRADELFVGLDIGTTKVCVVVGDVRKNQVNVIGFGQTAPGDGIKKGIIVDIDKTTQAILDAVEMAEKMADAAVQRVYVGIAGSHISSINSQGIVAVKGNSREITNEDIDRAVDNAKTAVPIPATQEIIHILPREFVVDEQKEINNPLGMVGSRLEAQVHIVTGAVTAIQNIFKCCENADLKVEEIVLQPYASAMAALTEDERKLGVVLVDIGGGTTDLIIFQNGHVVHCYSSPVGGQYVTNDIAVGLKTSTAVAENLKIKFGVARADLVDERSSVEVPVAGGERTKTYPQKFLAEIIEPRMEEIFNTIKEQITRHVSIDVIPAGVVITGGCSLMNGCVELAEEILGLPVRCGYPLSVTGLKEKVQSPEFATVVGLINYGSQNQRAETCEPGYFNGVVSRVKSFFRGMFTD